MKKAFIIVSLLLGVCSVGAIRVTLPTADVLAERLRNGGFSDLMQNTCIIDCLAGCTWHDWAVARFIVEQHWNPYCRRTKRETIKSFPSKDLDPLLLLVFNDFPDAIKELKSMRYMN